MARRQIRLPEGKLSISQSRVFEHWMTRLFAGVLTAVGALPADAQQTPQTYCAGLGGVSCEVLNIETTGMVNDAAATAGATLSYANQLIKYCRNQRFQFALSLITLNAQPTSSVFSLSMAIPGPGGTGTTVLSLSGPVGGWSGNAVSQQSLCTILP